MKKYRFHKKENPLQLAVIQDSFKIYFQEIEKKRFEILAQKGFQQLENQFVLARMKDLLKNKFTLDGKIFN